MKSAQRHQVLRNSIILNYRYYSSITHLAILKVERYPESSVNNRVEGFNVSKFKCR